MYILVTKKDGKLIFFNKNEKEVAFCDKDAILSYYEAAKAHSRLTKTSHPALKMINLLDPCMNNFAETIQEKLLDLT